MCLVWTRQQTVECMVAYKANYVLPNYKFDGCSMYANKQSAVYIAIVVIVALSLSLCSDSVEFSARPIVLEDFISVTCQLKKILCLLIRLWYT